MLQRNTPILIDISKTFKIISSFYITNEEIKLNFENVVSDLFIL